jgi:hypothetical protein
MTGTEIPPVDGPRLRLGQYFLGLTAPRRFS